MKNDNLTNRIGLYLLIGFLSAGILFVFVIKPIYAKAQESKSAADQEKAKIAALEQLEKDTEELRANYEQVKEERDRILSLLPPKNEEERLLALLSNLAGQSGASLSTFAPEISPAAAQAQAEQGSSLIIYPITINVTGSYPSVISFIEKVEQGARFVDVDQGSITSGSGGAANLVGARLTLRAYYQGKPVNATGGNQ